MMELAGKTGIITGGSSGLGFAAANVLAEAGAVVYAVSRSGRPKLEGETSHKNVGPGTAPCRGDFQMLLGRKKS